ncbi:hypothetical protein [Nannocystis exedens]|uniref:hypothetical protein n=1 Tax=Nannocystis exedens TaxID=54 RepID=UPI000BBA0C25|nr:hypothetical protein [Nannocystis exedens]
MKRLGGVLSGEDLLWAGWLALLRPASGGLFLEGGRVSWFLVLAAAGFWASALTSERGGGPRRGTVLLMSLGICAIMIDAGLKQVGAAIEVRQVHTAVVLVLGALAAIQHQRTRGAAWVQAPRWLRRGLSWPFMMVLAEMFWGMMEAMAAPKAWIGPPVSTGERLFSLGFVFLVSLPVVYVFFVVAPRLVACPGEHVRTGGWVLRYLWAVATALFGALVLGPLLGDT